ncbi:hypothetical protein NPS01_19990 [Nocardioides psychrotolerans]|uniref:Collagen triple helix repeat-containing protein n=1 Tax=Nocardioides psychrotolerans TaxID=1005945 RepID=A0A1I3JWA2_9ACTN|nr:hypothetical protein [Nocardioides psychrotolerans]GEP38336.1 hypothetical protein NPS01_19990 [Nocardioides psychrotolerans]SFI64511.1 hypothetical protein SAMN05216561_11151 [Nocardioides psychrotolerans]
MNRSSVTTMLAASAVSTLLTVGAAAAPAFAADDTGKGTGPGSSQGPKGDQGPKGNNGNGPKSDQGPKGNNGNGPKGDQGPKGNNGNGPKGDQGPKGNNGNGPKGDQGPKGNNGNGPKGDGGPKGDPAGNNGTVKITPIGQDDGIPQNNPHVTCGFDIEWYGFDEGADIVSSVTLAMHAPTKDVVLTPGGPSTKFVGGDSAGGGTDFDGEATYYPTFDGEPHPKQGYHIKLTVNTPGSQGADTKHKVFWVQPCDSTTPLPGGETPGEEPTPGEETPGGETPAGETPDQGVQGETATSGDSSSDSDSDQGVLGTQAEADSSAAAAQGSDASAVPTNIDAGEEGTLSRLVTSPVGLVITALGVALAAAGLLARRRRVTPTH